MKAIVRKWALMDTILWAVETGVHLSRLSRPLFSQSLNKLELTSRLPDLKVSKTIKGGWGGGRVEVGDCFILFREENHPTLIGEEGILEYYRILGI